MKVGDLVRIKETGELGVITEIWMRHFIPSSFVYWFSSKDEACSDLNDLELVE